MRRLIVDITMRHRWSTAVFVVVLFGMWWLEATLVGKEAPGAAASAFGISLGWAYMFGPWRVLFLPRAIWHLPISRRDIGRARWLAATLIPTAFTTTAKLVAMLVPAVRASFSLMDVLLSSTYDFAYTGLGCGLIIAASARPATGEGLRHRALTVARAIAQTTWPLGMTVPMVLAGTFGFGPFRVFPPTHWADMSARGGVVLVAMLAMTIAAYFHSPRPPLFGRHIPTRPRARSSETRRIPPGLSGFPRLFLHEYAWTLLLGGGITVGAILVVLVGIHIRSPQELAPFLRMELARFDGVMPPAGEGADPFMVLVMLGCFTGTIVARYPTMMRHLRVLPVGTVRLHALLVAWPAAIWMSIWLVFITLHYLFVGRMVNSLHVPAFIGLAGSSALVVALSLGLSGPQSGLAFSSLLIIVPMLMFLGFPPAWASIGIGASGFLLAGALNRSSLGRSSTYRHSDLPGALPLSL